MPARRLPWVKLWPELMEREKVRRLSDSQYRTWTYCLLAGSQQPTRWRFQSLEHAAYVTRRPLKDMQALADHHFLDQAEDGVWIHDAHEYQDVAPSDIARQRSANDDPTPDDHPPNGRGTLVESSANGRYDSASRTRGERERGEREGEGRVERGERDVAPAPSERPPRRVSQVDDVFKAELEEQFWEVFGSREAVRDSIEAAMAHKARLKYSDVRAYLRNWVRNDAGRAQSRRGGRVVPLRTDAGYSRERAAADFAHLVDAS